MAALTLPTLIQKYQEQARVSQLKKAYAILQNAFQMARNEYGEITEWGLTKTNTGKTDADGNPIYDFTGSNIIARNLGKYISGTITDASILKDLGLYSLDGRFIGVLSDSKDNPVIQFKDGTIVNPGWTSNINCNTVDYGLNNMCGGFWVYIPTRYRKGAYTIGVDAFYVLLTKEGFFPYRGSQVFSECDKNNTAISAGRNGRGCAALVLTNGNMDYLHK